MEEWQQHDLDLCEVPGRLNESLFCYTHVFNYQRLDVEVLSEDPILIIYRNFAPQNFVADFISDARRRIFTTQEVVDRTQNKPDAYTERKSRIVSGAWIEHEDTISIARMFRFLKTMLPFVNVDNSEMWQEVVDRTQNKQDAYTKRPSRIVSGAWIEHEDTISIARMFRFLKTMLPFVNVDNSEMWQVLSYHPGNHYAPHYDYIPEQYDSFVKKIGNRFATFLLMLPAGRTVFPDLQTTVMLSAGDAVFWTNMEANGEVLAMAANPAIQQADVNRSEEAGHAI
ncbi:hypothetical protein OSTOST_07553 [Ostertagia ostertagi]